MQIDSHAHQVSDSTQILVGVHTFAIHPWDLTLPFNRNEYDLKWKALVGGWSKPLYALGECGLDRVHEGIASIDDQKYVLMRHFEFALEKKIPLIIHCVRAYSDLLQMLRKMKFPYPIMLHAYGGNEQEMHELLKYPVYFSYGARLFNSDKMLKLTPMDRLLLETGDQKNYSIGDIYEKASESLGMERKALEGSIEKNFLSFFDKHDDVGATHFIQDLNARKSNR